MDDLADKFVKEKERKAEQERQTKILLDKQEKQKLVKVQ